MTHVFIGLWFGFLAFAETHRALRRQTQPKLRRNARNLLIASSAMAVKSLVEQPVAEALSRWVVRRRIGIVQWLLLPPVVAVLLMDYTLYLWHVLTHKAPVLWRAHRVHHIDLDLDASTATRFHFAEMLASVPFRAVQIVAIGTSLPVLRTWQSLLLFSILFHHSNWRLPKLVDHALAWIVVTPRLHGIHHSIEPQEVNSNFSSGLTLWDRVHRTYRERVTQEEIVIGVPEYLHPGSTTLRKMLSLPFRG